MDIQIKELPKSEVELTITVDADTIQQEKSKALDRLSQGLKVPGFRKGKVPVQLARSRISESEIRAEMLERCIPVWYVDALRQKELKVISDPRFDVKSIDEGQPLVFTATATVYPPVKLGDFRKIKVKPQEVVITEKDVAESLELLRKNRATFQSASKKAEKEDIVVLNVRTTLGTEEVKAFTRQDYQHLIGEGFFAPGFDEQVTGLAKGDIKKFTLTLPDNYPIERFRQQTLECLVTVLEVKSKQLPAIDDAFAQSFKARDVADLKEQLKSQLELSRAHQAEHDFQNAVLEKASDQSSVEVPEVLIHDEIDHIERELEWRLKQQGFTLDLFLKSRHKTLSEMHTEWRAQAEKVAKLNLVLDAIAKAENIDIKPEELETEMSAWLNSFRDQKGQLRPEGHRMRTNLQSINGRLYLTSILRRDKTKKLLYEIAHPVEPKKESIPKSKKGEPPLEDQKV